MVETQKDREKRKGQGNKYLTIKKIIVYQKLISPKLPVAVQMMGGHQVWYVSLTESSSIVLHD